MIFVDSWAWIALASQDDQYHDPATREHRRLKKSRRRYVTKDDSRNNPLVAAITLGEGWHNNHHYYQSSANQGFFWWEIDISYYLIRLFSLFGLVWDIRTPGEKVLNYRRTDRTSHA